MTERISKHLKESELRCGCGQCEQSIQPDYDYNLAAVFELCRFYVTQIDPNGYIYISSGARCFRHNKKEGGRPASRHIADRAKKLECMAIDMHIRAKDVDTRKMYRWLCNLFPSCYGIGYYTSDGRIHIDTREYAARWVV